MFYEKALLKHLMTINPLQTPEQAQNQPLLKRLFADPSLKENNTLFNS